VAYVVVSRRSGDAVETVPLEEPDRLGAALGELPAILIGKRPTCRIHLPHQTVSSTHARLRCDESGAWHVLDLGSMSGVFVNGRMERREKLLADGDRIAIGDFVLELRLGPVPVAPEPGSRP
jgi:pSer/pThr/pTyr-binding forkhead associated (FHA) protein